MVVGYDDGRLATLDLAGDRRRCGRGRRGAPPARPGRRRGRAPVRPRRRRHDHRRRARPARGRGLRRRGDGRRRSTSPGSSDIGPGGTGDALQATLADVPDPAAAAAVLAELLDGEAADYEAILRGDRRDGLRRRARGAATRARPSRPPSPTAGSRASRSSTVSRVAAATDEGVTFIDPATVQVIDDRSRSPAAGTASRSSRGIEDDRLYVTSGTADEPTYDVIAVAGDAAKDGPTGSARAHPLPGLGSDVVYDPASQMVHILGLAPGCAGRRRGRVHAGPWTVYVIEPHGNAVFADARLADGFTPVAWAADIDAEYPSTTARSCSSSTRPASTASIELGSHAFAWRLPGRHRRGPDARLPVPAGADPVPAPARRRAWSALFVLADGMFFVQSRIGMNDVYVGLFIVAAYTVFAAVWTGWWRGRAAFWVAMPIIGRAARPRAREQVGRRSTPSAALALLILVRSALGRVVAILGLIALTSVLGYLAISVPEGQGFGNLTFLLIMVALTLLAVVVAVFHPDRLDRRGDALRGHGRPRPLGGASSSSGRSGPAASTSRSSSGSFAVTPAAASRSCWPRLARGRGPSSGRRAGSGSGRSRRRPGRTTRPATSSRPRRRRTAGCAPAGCSGCRCSGPRSASSRSRSAVYVVSYIPWAMIENHQLVTGWPVGHTGQTLLDLTDADVRLPQRADRAAPGLVAVVGLAARPQARVVLPGGPRGRDGGGDLRRRQPRHLVARRRGDGLRQRAWRIAGAASRWRSSPSGSRRSGSRGRASTAPPSSTTTTRPCRSWSWPSPTSSPRSGTAPRAARGCSPGSPARWRSCCPAAAVAVLAAAVRARRRRVGQPGLGGVPGRHPRVRPHDADGRRSRSSSGVGLVLRPARRPARSPTPDARRTGRRVALVPLARAHRASVVGDRRSSRRRSCPTRRSSR